MSNPAELSTVWLIASRELATRLKTKAFVLGTLALLVLLTVIVFLPKLTGGDDDRSTIGLSGSATSLAGALTAAADQSGLELSVETDVGDERARVTDGSLTALVRPQSGTPGYEVLVRESLDPPLGAVLSAVLQREGLAAAIADLGGDPAEVIERAQPELRVTPVEPPDPNREIRLIVTMAAVFLLYIGIVQYGVFVTQGVVEEKQSRVVEILLATVRPWQLMVGKIVGIGLVALLQLSIFAVAGVGLGAASGAVAISDLPLDAVAWSVLWFVLGFFLYATLFAAGGALVSRQEDATGIVTPIAMLVALGFFIGVSTVTTPGEPVSLLVRVASQVPFWSPVIMPGRIAGGTVSPAELALSLILIVVTLIAVAAIGSRVYRNAVLQTGARVKLRDALR